MKRIVWMIAIAFFAVSLLGHSSLVAEESTDSEEITNLIANNVIDECLTCAGYYWITQTSSKKLTNHYEKLYDNMVETAFNLALDSRSEEMASKVVSEKLDLIVTDLYKEMDGSFKNLSILKKKYDKRCKTVVEDPEQIMNEWTEKIHKKYGYSENAIGEIVE